MRTAEYKVLRLPSPDLETSPDRNFVTAEGIPMEATAIMMLVRLRTRARRPNPFAPMILATKTDSAKPIDFTSKIATKEENAPPRMKRRIDVECVMCHGHRRLLSLFGGSRIRWLAEAV